ncbi:ABC transporter permease [Paenibacillus darwinianus]|uniref:ABC transporter permease n=1 Tax=Paenibacillus darwinianus TaxID=1380763 RepID=UPI00044FB98E|nr:ABC transporter permease subunit [Paenibacillus darwinianus]EXX84775.1 ABC transporter permease [Paenibacillus darwinianus]EXX86082.1 ABC transporter permease [Paenibacillus darwinianus]
MRIFLFDARKLQTAVWLVLFLLVWEGVAWSIRHWIPVTQPETKWPYFTDVMTYVFANLGMLFKQGGITFANALSGFAIGSLVGLLLALIMSLSATIERIITPYIVSSQMVPIVGLAPIVFGILRDADMSRISMAAYVTFFPVAINALSGLSSIPSEKKELFASYASSKPVYYWKLALPSALPYLFLGMKLAAPLSITASIVVELMGAPNGIGVTMVSSLYYGSSQSTLFWATLFFSALIGLAAYLVISVIERVATPWQPEFRSTGGGNT